MEGKVKSSYHNSSSIDFSFIFKQIELSADMWLWRNTSPGLDLLENVTSSSVLSKQGCQSLGIPQLACVRKPHLHSNDPVDILDVGDIAQGCSGLRAMLYGFKANLQSSFAFKPEPCIHQQHDDVTTMWHHHIGNIMWQWN